RASRCRQPRAPLYRRSSRLSLRSCSSHREDVRHVRYAVERESTFTEKQSTHLRAGREQDSAHQTIVNAKRCDVSPLAKRRGDRISESVSQGFFQRALLLRHKKKTFFFRRVRIAILSKRVLACKDLHPIRHEVHAIKN